MIFTIKNKIISEKQHLEKEIESIQNKINKLPDGKLVFVHNGKYIRWHQSDGHQSKYIPKKNRKLAEQLAVKKYLCLKQDELSRKLAAVDMFLQQSETEDAAQQLFETPEYAELLSSLWVPETLDLEKWMNEPYERNQDYPEKLVVKTNSGIRVRSKSEMIIAMILNNYKIPFRYECALHLGALTIFPDFTIRHPQTGEYFYWEHFGMMDDSSYAQKTFSKLQLYVSNNIIPTTQLITTYETKEQPLDARLVETMVKHYFL